MPGFSVASINRTCLVSDRRWRRRRTTWASSDMVVRPGSCLVSHAMQGRSTSEERERRSARKEAVSRTTADPKCAVGRTCSSQRREAVARPSNFGRILGLAGCGKRVVLEA
jgi:hypothetical protein